MSKLFPKLNDNNQDKPTEKEITIINSNAQKPLHISIEHNCTKKDNCSYWKGNKERIFYINHSHKDPGKVNLGDYNIRKVFSLSYQTFTPKTIEKNPIDGNKEDNEEFQFDNPLKFDDLEVFESNDFTISRINKSNKIIKDSDNNSNENDNDNDNEMSTKINSKNDMKNNINEDNYNTINIKNCSNNKNRRNNNKIKERIFDNYNDDDTANFKVNNNNKSNQSKDLFNFIGEEEKGREKCKNLFQQFKKNKIEKLETKKDKPIKIKNTFFDNIKTVSEMNQYPRKVNNHNDSFEFKSVNNSNVFQMKRNYSVQSLVRKNVSEQIKEFYLGSPIEKKKKDNIYFSQWQKMKNCLINPKRYKWYVVDSIIYPENNIYESILRIDKEKYPI